MMAYDASEAEPPAPAVDKVETLESALRGRTPQRILSAALDAFPGRIALVSSFGAESAVLLHMVSQIDPNTPILFLDTGMQFGQTLDYRRTLAERLGLTDEQVVINIDRYGNTTAATIPLAMDTARSSDRLNKGDLVLIASVGAGFTVGASLLRWEF